MNHLIVDGLNVFIRAFVANPTMDANGNHVGGLVGFLMMLNKLVREIKPDNIIIVWDGEGGSWKRRSMYKDYKAGRKPKLNREYDMENPEQQIENMKLQLLNLKKYLNFIPVTQITVDGVEADDVIAYLWNFSISKEHKKVIVSSDRDFYQLLDNNTALYVHTKKKFYHSYDLLKEINVLPENYIFVKALCGDGSDNIKGIRGIGQKTVNKLFPFLNERIVELKDIFEHSEINRKEKNKYDAILREREIVIENVQLMQLTSPLMDPSAARSIRKYFNEMQPVYKPTEMKMQLIRDGLQIKAADFFKVFKEQNHRCVLKRGLIENE